MKIKHLHITVTTFICFVVVSLACFFRAIEGQGKPPEKNLQGLLEQNFVI